MTEVEKNNLVQLLHEIVISAVKNVTTIEKYGGTLFSVRPNEKEGQFCGVFAFKNHVHLAFARGAELEDPDEILQGGGKYRRHLNFSSVDAVDAELIQRFIRAAIELG